MDVLVVIVARRLGGHELQGVHVGQSNSFEIILAQQTGTIGDAVRFFVHFVHTFNIHAKERAIGAVQLGHGLFSAPPVEHIARSLGSVFVVNTTIIVVKKERIHFHDRIHVEQFNEQTKRVRAKVFVKQKVDYYINAVIRIEKCRRYALHGQ